MFPYLDLAGFAARATLTQGQIAYIEEDSPGYVARRIALRSSYINGRLRKRYGNNHKQDSLPLGQMAPLLLASGTSPPGVTLKGRPILGSLQVQLQITTGGSVGSALFSLSLDGGYTTSSTGLVTGASVSLPKTGMQALFTAGNYSTDNLYAAATPVPEIVLGWLTAMVTYDVYRRRGVEPADPVMQLAVEDLTNAMAELKEAADSKDGLFDLPSSEDEDSAVTTGGPLGHSQGSPYVWTDIEADRGYAEDFSFDSDGDGDGR